jgi:3-oxoacyl-(acyl-carrier-protein) synthase
MGIPALLRALAEPGFQAALGLARPDGPSLPVAVCRDFSTANVLPPLVARRLDRPSRLLAVAAREALAAFGDQFPWERERVGITAGTWNAGTSALLEVLRTVFLASPDEAPPAQFPSTVANAPASQLGILEKLGGPNITFAEKQVGGLRAIAEAGRMLLARRADAVLACGADEADWLNAEGYLRLGALRTDGHPGMVLCEGAAALVLARDPGSQPLAALAGWASAATPAPPYKYPDGPSSVVQACTTAIARAGITPRDIDLVVSMANGIPALDELELTALAQVLGPYRPAAVGASERFGDGAAAGTLRALIAALAAGGATTPAWDPPPHLAGAGFPTATGRARTVLVAALAGGGSALALVFTAV